MSFGFSVSRRAPEAIAKALREAGTLSLSATTPTKQLTPLTMDPQTSAITLRLRRPTTALPVSWDTTSTVQIALVVTVDGTAYRCTGQATGGIRTDRLGVEMPWYSLTWRPPFGLLGGQTMRRLGETAVSSFTAHVEWTRVSGTIQTEFDVISGQAAA